MYGLFFLYTSNIYNLRKLNNLFSFPSFNDKNKMTQLEHIYAVKSLLDRGPSSQSQRFTNRLIAHYLTSARALLLKRKLDKERIISSSNYQKFCMPLEKSDFANCPGCDVPSFDCNLLKGTVKLPNAIRTRWGHSYIIRDLLGNIISNFNLTNTKYKQYSLTQSENNLGWFENSRDLYIITDQMIPLVLVEAVFEDPQDIAELPICQNSDPQTACVDFSESEDFAIDPELIMPMYEMTLQLMGIGINAPEDQLLNASQPKLNNVIE